MDNKALQLCARFSIGPNSLGYCGLSSATHKLRECISDNSCEGVDKEITKFIVLYPYLKTISAITKQPIYSYEVIESFWLGNSQLKKAKPEHYFILLEEFKKMGVPQWLLDELVEKTPNKFIPFHLFQVLHVGVGRASGAVPFNMETINNCMVRWGKVRKILKDEFVIALNSVEKTNNHYTLVIQEKKLKKSHTVVSDIQMNDTVAVHWNLIAKRLTPKEEHNIRTWSEIVCGTV